MSKTYKGKTYKEWAKELGCSETVIYLRVKRGWSEEKAVTTPITEKNDSRGLKYDIVGKTFFDRNGNEFIVEGFSRRINHVSYYKVKFLKSGYTTEACSSQIRGIGGTHVSDHLFPTFAGVGMLGYAKPQNNSKIMVIWKGMIDRCYNTKNKAYKNYGAKGITVCERWKRFDLFLEDVESLPGYNKEKIENGMLCLDKDIIDRSKLIYSPETCSFVTRSENSTEANKRRWNKNKV